MNHVNGCVNDNTNERKKNNNKLLRLCKAHTKKTQHTNCLSMKEALIYHFAYCIVKLLARKSHYFGNCIKNISTITIFLSLYVFMEMLKMPILGHFLMLWNKQKKKLHGNTASAMRLEKNARKKLKQPLEKRAKVKHFWHSHKRQYS